MVTVILDSAGSTGSTVRYNEDKVAKAEADLVFTHLIDGDGESAADVYRTLERAEKHPGIRPNVKDISFHMAVNPGTEDSCNEQDVLMYINDLMDRLGYGRQPYAVYRHEDIDRGHYHVASVRVMPDGHTVPNHFEGRRVAKIQKELAPVYGFHVGINKEKAMVKEVPEKITYGESHWTAKAVRKIEDLLTYDFYSMETFQDLFEGTNIGVAQASYDGRKYEHLVFWIKDETGKAESAKLSAERDLYEPLYKKYKEALTRNRMRIKDGEKPEPSEELEDTCREAVARCDSAQMLQVVLQELGYRCAFKTKRKTGEVDSFRVIDDKAKAIYDIEDIILGYTLDRLTAENEDRPVTDESIRCTVTEVRRAVIQRREERAAERGERSRKENGTASRKTERKI